MLLAVDVGNTNIMVGVFREQKIAVCWRLATDWNSTEDELGITIKSLLHNNRAFRGRYQRRGDLLGGPSLIYSWKRWPRNTSLCRRAGEARYADGPEDSSRQPPRARRRSHGQCSAGYRLYGGPLIIVDFGTATTFCAISAEGHYLGGAIAPGIGISVEALFEKAAKLPRVELVCPPTVIGKSTIAGLQSGIVYGFVGQVDGIVQRMSEEFPTPPLVVATGGFASLIARESKTIVRVNPLLTLEGLQIIYRQQQDLPERPGKGGGS